MIVFTENQDTNVFMAYEVNQNSLAIEENSDVEIILKNPSSNDIVTSNYYWIEKNCNGQWENIPFYKEFEDVEVIIEPDDEVTFLVSLELYEDDNREQPIDLSIGHYRIRKEYCLHEFGEDMNDLFIEFEVTEE